MARASAPHFIGIDKGDTVLEQTASGRKPGNAINTLLRICLLAFAALRLINYFYAALPLQIASCLIMVIVMGFSMFRIDKMTRRVIIGMFVVGAVLMIVCRASAKDWLFALLKNGNLLTLLTMAPMLSAPFFYEDYQGELKTLAQARMQNLLGFLVLLTISSHLLGVLVSIGAIIIVYDLLHPFGDLYKAKNSFLVTLERSYCSSGFWSPAWASVIVYSAYPDVKWTTIVPVAIGFSILFNVIGLGGLALNIRRNPDQYPKLTPPEGATVNWKKIVTMLVLFAGMIGTIVLFDVFTDWDLMFIVPVAAVLFPLLAAAIQKHWKAYGTRMESYYTASLMKVPSQVALYATAGFLGKAMELSGVGELLPRLLPDVFSKYPPLMIMAMVLLMVIPSLVGIHPAATGTAMVAALVPATLGLSNYTFCLAILFGWLLTILMSPFSSQSLILSGYTGVSNWKLSVGNNWKFAAVCLVVFALLISVVGPMLG